MNFRILTPTWHGALDYAAAAALIVLPFLLDLASTSSTAHWLSVLAGLGLAGYSMVTDYAFGIVGALSFRAHLVFDLLAAVVFIAAPFVFGWSGIVLGYYLVMAAGVGLSAGLYPALRAARLDPIVALRHP